MTFLEDLVLVVHVLAALAIIGVVMLQHGKGADMGAGFGSGASATVFGATGSGNFLTKTTTVAAIVFFLTSFSLAFFAKERAAATSDVGMPMQTAEQPADQETGEAIAPASDDEFLAPEMAEMGEELPATEEGDEGVPELPELE